MTLQEITAISRMRASGYTLAAMALALGKSPNTIKSHLRRHPVSLDEKICLHCGQAVAQLEGRKPRKFCNDACRMAYWNAHQATVNRKAYYRLVCRNCKKEYQCYGNDKRKYCSRDCYNQARSATRQ